jgi:hypothetical protein
VIITAAVCWPCVVALHHECLAPDTHEEDGYLICCCKQKETEINEHENSAGRPVADPSDITDVVSTGRRRAQMLYPIMTGMLCEWTGLKNAGGGIEPIVGCDGNTIEATKSGPHAGHRHHGPNKNVIDNVESNVHRICTTCHNRWHAANNKYYLGERPPADQSWLPVPPEGMELRKHDPDTVATEEEREESDNYWKSRKLKNIDTTD